MGIPANEFARIRLSGGTCNGSPAVLIEFPNTDVGLDDLTAAVGHVLRLGLQANKLVRLGSLAPAPSLDS